MEQLQDRGLKGRQTYKSGRRCGPWALYHGAKKGWSAHRETDSQIKEKMWALNHGANKGWRAHRETDP